MREWTNENRLLIIVGIAVLGLWSVNFYWGYPGEDARGTFGDAFGAVNSLFTGLALAGLVYTIVLQRKEMSKTQEMLEQQEEQIKGQKEALDLQVFENTLMHMLEAHRMIVESISVTDSSNSDTILRGQAVFNKLFGELQRGLDKFLTKSYTSEPYCDQALSKYNDILKKYGNPLRHYFRQMYYVLKYIDSSKLIDNEKKQFYADLLRSQISASQHCLLYFNGLSKEGENFKPLMEKYGMLRGLPEFEVIKKHIKSCKPKELEEGSKEERKGGYKQSAFESQKPDGQGTKSD